MKKRMALFLAIIMVASSFLGACGDKKTSTKKDDTKAPAKQELNILSSSEIPSMDSVMATDSVSFEVMNNVLEGLYRLGEDGVTPVPGMATKYDKSEDGKTYKFYLRDAKWSNGDTVTAKDFEYAWKRLINPDTAAEYSYIMPGVIKNAAAIQEKKAKVEDLGVKALDDKTLEVTLENPVPYFLSMTAFPVFFPQNQKFVEGTDKFGTEADKVVYNGPFTLSEWKHEESYTLSKNPTYWDASTVKLEKVNYKIVKETSTAVSLYETKKVDRVGLDAEYVDKYKSAPEYGTFGEATLFFLRLNEQNKVLKNVNARKAISMAIDKQAYCDVLLNNGSTPANYLVPKGFVVGPDGKDFRENGEFNAYNTDEAKKLWEQAKKELGMKTVKLELLNYDGDSAKKAGEYMKEQLEKNLPGFTLDIKQQPFKQKLELESKFQYDISYAGWGPDYQDPMTFVDMFITDGPYNQMKYTNKTYDGYVADSKGKLLLDLPARWTALQAAEKLLFDDAAIVPLYQRGRAYVQRPYVKNIVKHPIGGDYSYKWTYIEK